MNAKYNACAGLEEVILQFDFHGKRVGQRPYGNGHINDTFLLEYEDGQGVKKHYILQRMNGAVFKEPEKLMENLACVTKHLRDKVIAKGGDPEREALNLIQTKSKAFYYQDALGDAWRAFLFVERTRCLEKTENEKEFYYSGVAFGEFQQMLADFPASALHETIPNFHNTPARFCDFQKAAREAAASPGPLSKRAELAGKEIWFVLSREREASLLVDLLREGELPLRVTHNDTKLNNVLFDQETGRALCVIDLDTVMPGLSLYDFGDAIRFGANAAAEDETDLSCVSLNLAMFEAFTDGYLTGCNKSLSEREIELLPMGAKLMTYECGMRFLADYLQGDVYFKTCRGNHNLDRARTQFRLLLDMERKWEEMKEIVRKYNKK